MTFVEKQEEIGILHISPLATHTYNLTSIEEQIQSALNVAGINV